MVPVGRTSPFSSIAVGPRPLSRPSRSLGIDKRTLERPRLSEHLPSRSPCRHGNSAEAWFGPSMHHGFILRKIGRGGGEPRHVLPPPKVGCGAPGGTARRPQVGSPARLGRGDRQRRGLRSPRPATHSRRVGEGAAVMGRGKTADIPTRTSIRWRGRKRGQTGRSSRSFPPVK
jgi:hypothetical protein